MIRNLHLHLILIVLLAACSLADTQSETETTAVNQLSLDRISVIGASASAGFGVVLRYEDENQRKKYQPITLNDIVEATIDHEEMIVSVGGSGGFFWNPVQIGSTQKSEASEAKPTLVLAIDYLFWYGYGSRDRSGNPMPRGSNNSRSRLELLNIALENLETFECPVILGDFPDVSDAVGRMLSPNQIPNPETLKMLNARVNEWAAEHPNVILLPLHRLMEHLRSNDAFEAGKQNWPAGSKSRFMQNDNLHPRLEGLIVLLQEAAMAYQDRHPEHAWPMELNLEHNRQKIYEAHRPEGCTSAPYEHDD
ncbi:MAG: hypothetical protein CMJ39_02770 [Phycisphaerae bacterium]|nr:hypothetical protein [Phycisphaerae bacterium]